MKSLINILTETLISKRINEAGGIDPVMPTRKSLGLDSKAPSIFKKSQEDSSDHVGHESGVDYGLDFNPKPGWKKFWADWNKEDKTIANSGNVEMYCKTCGLGWHLTFDEDADARFSKDEYGTNNRIADVDDIQEFLIDLGKDVKVTWKFDKNTAIAVGDYLGYPSITGYDDLLKYLAPKYPDEFGTKGKDDYGIGPRAQGVIADLLSEKCVENLKKCMNRSYFEAEYGKTREEFKDIFWDAAVDARTEAINWIIEYYSEKHPDNFNKLVPTRFGFDDDKGPLLLHPFHHTTRDIVDAMQNNWDLDLNKYEKEQLYDLRLATYNKLRDKLISMRDNDYSLRIFYCCEGDFYGWVKDSDHLYRYNMNIYRFINPTEAGWEHSFFSTTLHELGHLVDNILWYKLGVDPYPGDLHQDEDETTAYDNPDEYDDEGDLETRGPYVTRKSELYARMFNLRHYFGVHSNINGEEWAKAWMKKVNSGEIAWAKNYMWSSTGNTPPEFGIGNPKHLVWLELTTRLIRSIWKSGRLHDLDPDEWSYDDIWSIVNKIRYNIGDDPDDDKGYGEAGLAALLATFTFDPQQFNVKKTDRGDKFWIVFDFNKIAEANRLYVSIDPKDVEEGDSEKLDDLYAFYERAKNLT